MKESNGSKTSWNADSRKEVWDFLIHELDRFYADPTTENVSPKLDIKRIRSAASKFNFEKPTDSETALQHVISNLREFQVHTPHPSYFGLFNPRPAFPGILADVITAFFNPQMAAWSHSPFATEVENYCIQQLGMKFGYSPDDLDGTFCSGGAEANLTATLCALESNFPDFGKEGIGSITEDPVIYCSKEAHHSVVRSAKITGIGLKNVTKIGVNEDQQMIPELLEEQVKIDLKAGKRPFMVVANAGSTGTGAIDPLEKIGALCKYFGIWYHVDAAYGGSIIVSGSMRTFLKGIELSDSLTIDIHKWFSAPMATSIFMTSHRQILGKTFSIDADYMPKEASDMTVEDPFAHSIQWSRRFIGLKFYMLLLMGGWTGLEKMVDRMTAVGEYLKTRLRENSWDILNNTYLPIACFTDSSESRQREFIQFINKQVLESGEAWISIYQIGQRNSLRACITNYESTELEIDKLLTLLNKSRDQFRRL